MSEFTPQQGRGPWIILPDDPSNGHISVKFPDEGEFPFWFELEVFFREMCEMITAANLARYTVALFDPEVSDNAGGGGAIFGGSSQQWWLVPHELLDSCPVPIIVGSFNTGLSPGTDVWAPLTTQGASPNFPVWFQSEIGAANPQAVIYAQSNVSGQVGALRIAAIFLPYKSSDFTYPGYISPV